MKSQHRDLEKQLYSLKMASEPKKDEIDKLQELKQIIAVEEKEIERLTNGSKKLKEKVLDSFLYIILQKIKNCDSPSHPWVYSLPLFIFLWMAQYCV